MGSWGDRATARCSALTYTNVHVPTEDLTGVTRAVWPEWVVQAGVASKEEQLGARPAAEARAPRGRSGYMTLIFTHLSGCLGEAWGVGSQHPCGYARGWRWALLYRRVDPCFPESG